MHTGEKRGQEPFLEERSVCFSNSPLLVNIDNRKVATRMSATPSEKQGRGIDGIAHHFLSQCDGPKPPLRRGPGSNEGPSPVEPNTDPEPGANRVVAEPALAETADPIDAEFPMSPPPFPPHWRENHHQARPSRPTAPPRLAGVALLADHLRNSRQRCLQFAQQWADKNGPVALLDLTCPSPDLTEIVPAAAQTGPPAEKAGPVDEFWQQLFGGNGLSQDQPAPHTDTAHPQGGLCAPATLAQLLRRRPQHAQTLLINLPSDQHEQARQVLKQCRHAVVLTGYQSPEMVEAYKALKWISPLAWDDLDVSVFVCGGQDESDARAIQQKLADTAWDFLGVDVRWGGWTAAIETIRPTSLAQFAPAPALWSELTTLLDASHVPGDSDDSAVRRPHETSAQALGPERESCDDPLPTASSAADTFSTTPPQPKPAAPRPSAPPTPCAITLSQPPQSSRCLSDALQLALPAWLDTLPHTMTLPLTLPTDLDPAGRILVDAAGQLHIMLAATAPDDGLLTRSLALRAWLLDHTAEVTEQAPQVRLDPDAPVGLVLISPAPAGPLRSLCQQFPDLPCQVFQLHLTRTAEACSLLLV